MDAFIWQFSTRETSVIIWTFAIVFALFPTIRKAFRESGLLKSLLSLKLLVPIGVLVLYICVTIFLLHHYGIWGSSLLKDTLIWFMFAAPVMLSGALAATDLKSFLNKTIGRLLKLTVLIEFIVNFYTFNIFIELILVPFVVLLVMFDIVAGLQKEEFKPVKKLFSSALTITGLIILTVALAKLWNSPQAFFTIDSLQKFGLPIMLSAIFLPALYLAAVMSAYEQVFLIMNIRLNQLSKLTLKLRVIQKVGLRLDKIYAMRSYLSRELHIFRTYDEARMVIDKFSR